MRQSVLAMTMLVTAAVIGCVVCSWGAALEVGSHEEDKKLRAGTLRIAYDFGLVDQTSEVVRQFRVKNDSDEIIKFVDVRIPCGCVSLASHLPEINPGQSADITLKLDVGRQRGRITKTAIFKVKHPKYRFVQLVLEGTVNGVWIEPAGIDFGSLSLQDHPEGRFFVVAAGKPDLGIRRIHCDDPAIELTQEDPTTEESLAARDFRGVCSVLVKWRGGIDRPGLHSSQVLVDTTESDGALLIGHVTAHMTGALEAKPALLLFGRVKAGTTTHRTCQLRLDPAKMWAHLDELSFEANHDQVTCTVDQGKQSKSGYVSLRTTLTASGVTKGGLLKGAVKGKFKGELVLELPYIAVLAQE